MYQVLLFYKYVPILDPDAVRAWQQELCERLELKGRLIIATEGINVTLEGTVENTEAYIRELEGDERFQGIHFKKSAGTGQAFPRLSVKVRPEIVSAHLSGQDVDPTQVTGKYLEPAELNAWFTSGKEFYVVDMRNDYEHVSGQFEGSVLAPLGNFRDLPKVLEQIGHLKGKPIVTVCTGGVRCEKASGFLVKNGFSDVYQLHGGIVSYMEQYPNQHFLGKLYVFDDRILMGFNTDSSEHVVIGICERCGGQSEEYVNCDNLNCHKHFICCLECRSAEGAFCCEECRREALAPKIIPGMKLFLTSSTVTPQLLPALEKLLEGSQEGTDSPHVSDPSERTPKQSGKSTTSPGSKRALKVAFIPDGGLKDADSAEPDWITQERDYLTNELGWNVRNIVLAKLNPSTVGQLLNYDIIFVNGGLSGYLAQVMRDSGFADLLPKILAQGIVYIGSSGGSMVLSKEQDAESWYIGEPEPEAANIPGLGLIDFQIYPMHDHLYSPELVEQIKHKRRPDLKYYLLRDGQAISIHGEQMELIPEDIIVLEAQT